MWFDFEIEYKLGENNPVNRLSWRLNYTKGFKIGEGK